MGFGLRCRLLVGYQILDEPDGPAEFVAVTLRRIAGVDVAAEVAESYLQSRYGEARD
jgi:hypothetical protein